MGRGNQKGTGGRNILFCGLRCLAKSCFTVAWNGLLCGAGLEHQIRTPLSLLFVLLRGLAGSRRSLSSETVRPACARPPSAQGEDLSRPPDLPEPTAERGIRANETGCVLRLMH